MKRAKQVTFAAIVAVLCLPPLAVAQSLGLTPDRLEVTIKAGTPVGEGGLPVGIGNSAEPGVRFRAVESNTTVPAGGPRFLIVAPARGTTPATGSVSLDPEVVPFLSPGAYAANFRYALEDGTGGRGGFFTLRILPPSAPMISAVLHSASFRPVAAPGAVVSIFGANLGSPVKATKFDQFGMYPTTAGNVGVTFNGVAAALTYVSANQINAVVPNEVAGQGTARVVVAHHDERSAEFSVAVQETAPGIYMVGDGTSQGAITQTPPLSGNPVTVNSAANPVEKRGAIVFYATGAGLWNQDVRGTGSVCAHWRLRGETEGAAFRQDRRPRGTVVLVRRSRRHSRRDPGERVCAGGYRLRSAAYRVDHRCEQQPPPGGDRARAIGRDFDGRR